MGQISKMRGVFVAYLMYAAILLLSFIVFNLLITTVLFIFNVSVQQWYAPFSLLLSVMIVVFLLKRKKLLNIKSMVVVILLPIILLCGLTMLNGKVYDYTFDGNSYHKLAIGMMMDGWNPLMETEYEFNERNGEIIELGDKEFNWGDYYAKASHIFAANIGVVTGNVESGKIINDISIILVFLFILALCLHVGKTWLFSFLFAFVVVTPTTVVSQFMTNYVDILVYLYMFLLASLFFWFEYGNVYRKELLWVFFATLVIIINIKFSSFAYAGILCAFYYAWYIYRYRKEKGYDKKFFKQFTIIAFVSVLVGVFVVGLSVYPKNLLMHGHPFYPLMGEGKEDIMTTNSPDYFKWKNNVQRFIIATFSKMDNISEAGGEEAEYKVPFSITDGEMEHTKDCDLRISGNGVYFSGVLIVAIIIIVFSARELFSNDKKLFVMLALPNIMTILLIITMSDVWWARYFPQLHFVIFTAFIMIDRHKELAFKFVMYSLFGLMIVNNMMFFSGAIEKSYEYTQKNRVMVRAYKDTYTPEECRLLLSTNVFPGGFYNVRSDFSEYEIVFEDFDAETLDYVPVVLNYVKGRCQKK